MIRRAVAADLPALSAIAAATEMFVGDELSSFVAIMEAHLAAVGRGETPPEALIVATAGDDPATPLLGAAYFAPEVMAQGVFNLLFIGVSPTARNRRVGAALLSAFEDAAFAAAARLAIIETASADMFAPAWALYRRAGYEQDGRIRDFYDDGLDKIIFRKRL